MKIMIVDDHAEMRRLLRSALGHLASEFVECADGADAVAAFTDERPDWTIMDVAMKRMDGLEATRRIRSQSPTARILILTQNDSLPIHRAAVEAGAAAYLCKDRLGEIETLLTRGGIITPGEQAP